MGKQRFTVDGLRLTVDKEKQEFGVIFIMVFIFLLFALFLPAVSFGDSDADMKKANETGKQLGNSILDKYRSKEDINNYISRPLTGGGSMETVDGKKTFGGKLSCQSSKKFLNILAVPAASGDLSQVIIGQDTDLDGTSDNVYRLPLNISGVCANGIISCNAGTWDNCTNYKWISDSNSKINIAPAGISELGGCYCINNDCGNNLIWENLPVILKDLGGGIVGAIQKNNPKLAITEVKQQDKIAITYYAQASGNCINDKNGSSSPEKYFNNPDDIETDRLSRITIQSQDPDSYYSMMSNSAAAQDAQAELNTCSIKRNISLETLEKNEIISKVSGTGSFRDCGLDCVEIVLGNTANNYLKGDCTIFEENLKLNIKHPELIDKAILHYVKGDDYVRIHIDGEKIYSGLNSGSNDTFPPETPGKCDLGVSWQHIFKQDLTNYYKKKGIVDSKLRISVGGGGEGYALIKVYFKSFCFAEEQIYNRCQTIENNSKCRLKEEKVDHVSTYTNFHPTGLTPLSSCNSYNSSSCTKEICKDWWQKDRTYLCETAESKYNFDDALNRYQKIKGTTTDNMTYFSYKDMRIDKNGNTVNESVDIDLWNFDRAEYGDCESACKTRKSSIDTRAGSGEHTGKKRLSLQSYDFFYKTCRSSKCPLETGEEIIKDCQCINEFAEAATILGALNEAAHDLICSDGIKK